VVLATFATAWFYRVDLGALSILLSSGLTWSSRPIGMDLLKVKTHQARGLLVWAMIRPRYLHNAPYYLAKRVKNDARAGYESCQ
jgi:hypothetical protein